MMIQKTKEEEDKINQFVDIIADLIDDSYHDSELNVQEIFDRLKDKLFKTSGTIYLCFTCRQVVSRKELKKEQYFQLSNVWHDCREDISRNGFSAPTIGLITRWKDVLDYLESVDLLTKS